MKVSKAEKVMLIISRQMARQQEDQMPPSPRRNVHDFAQHARFLPYSPSPSPIRRKVLQLADSRASRRASKRSRVGLVVQD